MDRITIEVNGVSVVMLPVEGGTFMMGATIEQRTEAWENEKPIRNVTLSPYYLGETVVTHTLWDAVMGENSETSSNLPVTGKSWKEWQTFIGSLNALSGRRFRMPTEAEWENAARGGNKSRGCKYAGSNNINDVAWYDANSGSCVHPVMQKQPNELGLYDMTGNVFEWCYDKYGTYGEDPEIDPIGSATGSQRVYRGGAFSYYQRGCRLSCRFSTDPTGKDYSKIGLRLAMSEGSYDPFDMPTMGGIGTKTDNDKGKGVVDKKIPLESKTLKNEGQHTKTSSSSYWNDNHGTKKRKWPWLVGAGVVVLLSIIIITSSKTTPIKNRYVAGQITYGDLDQYITEYVNEFEINKDSILKKYLPDYSEGLGFIGATIIALNDYRSWIMEDSTSDYSETKVYLDRIDSLQNAFCDHIDMLLEVQKQTVKVTSDKKLKQEAQNSVNQLEEWKCSITMQQ